MFKRGKKDRSAQPSSGSADLVAMFLRGQNLEQVGKVEEAIPLYEQVVGSGFDAAGPYDRLIFIYQRERRHADVIRIAEQSIRSVRTYPQKLEWYRAQIAQANSAIESPPSAL